MQHFAVALATDFQQAYQMGRNVHDTLGNLGTGADLVRSKRVELNELRSCGTVWERSLAEDELLREVQFFVQ